MKEGLKIALVTGGSRGLGKDMALQLANKGIHVIVTYQSRREEAEKVVAEIEQKGLKAAAIQLDAAESGRFGQFFTELKNVLQDVFNASGIDYLINNAGIGKNSSIADATEELFDELMNINFKGVYFLTQGALPLLNEGGGIVNISSGLARFSYPGRSIYACAKGAVEVFTRYLAQELGPRGIRANVVAPGPIATDFGGGAVRDNEQVNHHLSSLTALGRVGLAEDIGGIVAFLCTEDARWINAQRIEASGGIHI